MIHDTLFKRDSTGRVRFWRLESDGTRFRTISGIHPDGSPVTSGWTTCTGKQGRSDTEQCDFEVAAKYKHQLDREYHATIDTVDEPNFFEPMLAKSYDGFKGPGFVQPKLDGMRCIARAEGLFTRQGQPIIAVPHIHAALAPLFEQDPDLILDGELYNHDLKDDFGELMSICRKKKPTVEQLEKAEAMVQYHVYDLPSESHLDFHGRFLALGRHVEQLDCGWVQLVETQFCETRAHADALHGHFLELGYEGSMFRLNAQYEQKRSKSLLKRKEKMSAEFKLLALEEGNGNWAGAAKRATLALPCGTQFGAGIKGSYGRGVELMKAVITDASEVTLEFFEYSPDGIPRFPVVVDIHLEGRVD